MARVKDQVIDLLNREKAWVDLLTTLFAKLNYTVVSSRDAFGPGPDLTVSLGDDTFIVELKLHRSERVPLALVRNAFAQLDHMLAIAGAQRGILIIPQRLVESHYSAVQGEHDLWDLDRLTNEAEPFPQIAADLADLLRELRVGAERAPEAPAAIVRLGDTLAELPPLGAGAEIAEKLEDLSSGRKNGVATKFEQLCEEALRLLFDKDLLNWRSQCDIEQGFQRVDVVARLQPTQSAFWSTLSVDFRARYVVFEFKNYSAPISQDQIYTTEKYLFTSALRSIAIIIARNGAAESANRAMQGALREQGKLIVCLSMGEFCSLLRGFDNGDNPEELLLGKVDDLLMAIAR